jgi:tetratricopeptide (TPR) repeat protein
MRRRAAPEPHTARPGISIMRRKIRQPGLRQRGTERFLLTVLRTAALAVVVPFAACAPRASEDGALVRGDVAFATGDIEEALAEYQLAARQGESAEAFARVGHAFAQIGRVEEARDFYRRAAEEDGRWADQAGSDLLHLARAAEARSDRFQMASAVETALEFLPGLSVEELALPLARHYFRNGEFGRALPFYQRALGVAADSANDVLMEVGTAYEEVGDCSRALEVFERHRDRRPPWDRSEVDWHIGTCSFQLARQRHEEGAREEALQLVDRTIEVGEPRNILTQVWFEKGEILSELGRCEEAIAAYRRVRQFDPAGTGALVRQAEERIDEVRFGTELREIRGRC